MAGERLYLDDGFLLCAFDAARNHHDGLAVHADHRLAIRPLHRLLIGLLNLAALLQQHRQHFRSRVLEWLAGNDLFRLLVPVRRAVAQHQHFFDGGIEKQKSVVLLVEDVVNAVRRLLCALDILCRAWLKLYGAVSA